MKIVDFRVRIPFKSYQEAAIFAQPDAMDAWAKKFHIARPKKIGTMEDVINDMDKAGVNKACFAGRRGHGVDNADIAEASELFKDKFYGFPEIDPLDGVDLAMQEIHDYVVNGPCRGIAIEPGFNRHKPMYADDKSFYFIYEECEKYELPLYLNFGGFIGSDYSYCDPILIEHILKDFPKLKILLAHAAYPFSAQACHVCLNHPNVYLGTDMYAFDIPGGDVYIKAANTFIGEQVCFGSAYPIFDIQASIDYYMNCGLNEDVLPKVMGENIEKFLGV